jgi:hypothetical protein
MSFDDYSSNALFGDDAPIADSPVSDAGDPGPPSAGAGGGAGPAMRAVGAGRLAAADALSNVLGPAVSAALQSPQGTLTKDRFVADTARLLGSARASGAFGDEHFGDLVKGAVGFLAAIPDDADDPTLRNAARRLGQDHLAVTTQLHAMAASGRGAFPANQTAVGASSASQTAAPSRTGAVMFGADGADRPFSHAPGELLSEADQKGVAARLV